MLIFDTYTEMVNWFKINPPYTDIMFVKNATDDKNILIGGAYYYLIDNSFKCVSPEFKIQNFTLNLDIFYDSKNTISYAKVPKEYIIQKINKYGYIDIDYEIRNVAIEYTDNLIYIKDSFGVDYSDFKLSVEIYGLKRS